MIEIREVSKMSLGEMINRIKNLSNEEQETLLDALKCNSAMKDDKITPFKYENDVFNLALLEQAEFSKLITRELKQQNITYEEMAMQIGVSIATFKRMVANPSIAKAFNLHALLKELGFKVCLAR